MLLDYFWKRVAIRAGGGHIRTNGESRPNVNELIKTAMSAYCEITEPKIKKKAAKLVKPFVKVTEKQRSIPVASSINWAKMEQDAAKVSALLKLWQEQLDLEDEEMLLMMMAN